MNVSIACGGTGGHIFPGMAVGRTLADRGNEVTLWLSSREVETTSVKGWNGPVISLDTEGFQGGIRVWRVCRAIAKAIKASSKCKGIMAQHRPDVVLAMGSYASVGPVMAARSLEIPVVLHESNAVPGRAIDFLSRFAECVAVTFEIAGRHLPRAKKIVVTGMPVRNFGSARFGAEQLNPSGFTVFISGGSQGASRLNDICSGALCKLHACGTVLQVIHSTGARDVEKVRSRYRDAVVPNITEKFIQDVEKAYNSANLAICRAGASTCAELLHFRLPALLVPLPSAKRNHQEANARDMAGNGVADVLLEKDMTEEKVMEYVADCMASPSKLEDMRKSAWRVPSGDGTKALADLVESIATGKK